MEIDYPSEGLFNFTLAMWLEGELESFVKEANPAQIMAFFT